jgi:tetratricopeptide (TPR) repeat protein
VKLQFRVRFAGARGDHEEVIKLLSQALSNEDLDPVVVAKFAGSYLPSIGHPAAAIEILSTLAETQHTSSSLFLLGELLLAQSTAKGFDSQPEVLSKLIAQLRELEGSDGTYWRLLLANSLIQQFAGRDENGPSARQYLQAADKLRQEIITLRPRWARGYALAGRLAAAEGESRQAVEMLRRSLAEGDSRISTVLLLVEELNRIGDIAAAEQELGRLESMTAANGRISATAVGLAVGQKQYDRALQHARESVAARPKDARAHLLLAQTALVAARAEQRKLTQKNLSKSASPANPESSRLPGEAVQSVQQLRDEAQRSLELALQISKKGDLGVWMAHFRSQLENGGHQAARQVLESMSNSPLPDDVRFLATANGYLAVGDLEKVQQWLEQAKRVSPTDPQVALTEARLARLNGDHQQLLLALKEAYRLAPQSPDVRRRLALALAVTKPDEIPWEQIDDLIGADTQDGSEVDELYHALIMINRGNTEQVEKAKNALRDVIAKNSGQAKLDAIRLLLAAERRDWKNAEEAGDRDLAMSSLEICQELYMTLIEAGPASPADLYGYGILLKDAGRESEAEEILSRLVEDRSTDPLTLALSLELIPKQAEVGVVRDQVIRWLDANPSSSSSVGKLSQAIQIMLKAGFADAAVVLTEELYSAAPHHLQNYVFTLSETGQTGRIVQVCYLHYKEIPSPLPIRLLAEAITQTRSFELITSKVEKLLVDAVSEFPTEVKTLEAIGTLRMTEERYDEAIAIFLHTEKISPLSLVTLNNLAVSFSETPGSEHEAVSRAERVVQLYGRNPELLDTLGVAQLRAGQSAKAEATLREACRQVSDPRYELHLVQVLTELGNRAEAQRIWENLDKAELAKAVLTPTDKER